MGGLLAGGAGGRSDPVELVEEDLDEFVEVALRRPYVRVQRAGEVIDERSGFGVPITGDVENDSGCSSA